MRRSLPEECCRYTIGALIVRIGFEGILDYNANEEPPKPYSNYVGEPWELESVPLCHIQDLQIEIPTLQFSALGFRVAGVGIDSGGRAGFVPTGCVGNG